VFVFAYKESLTYYFSIFVKYSRDHSIRLTNLEKFKQDVPGAKKLLLDFIENPKNMGLSIENFLQAPVRRVCKHPLLIRELREYSTDDKECVSLDYLRIRIEKHIGLIR